jgi:Zn finger protein HypA/HybF involved in hydrogenase expression
MPKKQTEMYRCQFCGQESQAKEWKARKDKCPKCGREYDAMLAQETEDD